MTMVTRLLTIVLLLAPLVACSGAPRGHLASAAQAASTPEPPTQVAHKQDDATEGSVCPLDEPSWAKPPDDSAVQNTPVFGHYYVNEDRSIWASAWWTGQEKEYLRASEDGIKVGWFRPAGATLEITGQRLDGAGPSMEANIPCCYPTQFQATGLIFPTEGCWQVTAKAAERELSFVVWVEP